MKNPILFFVGYRLLKTDACNSAKLLNLCLWNELNISGLTTDEDGSIQLFCSLKTANKLQKACQISQIPLTTVCEGGMPIALWKRRKRMGLLLGGVCALFLVFISGRFVWKVKISGNETMTAGEIERELSACGFRVGSYLPAFSASEIENRVLLQSDRLSWISICMNGTVAEVQVIERVEPAQPSELKPANLVAARDGQIEGMELYRGDCVVKIGQAVKAGEVLVSGIYDSNAVGYRFTRAYGKIFARTERDFYFEIPLSKTEKVYEKTSLQEIRLNFFGFSTKIFKKAGKENTSCDIIELKKSFERFGLPGLPISITEVRIRPYSEHTVEISSEEALEQAYRTLQEELKKLSPEMQLIKKDIQTKLLDDRLQFTCRITSIENIAIQNEIESAEMS